MTLTVTFWNCAPRSRRAVECNKEQCSLRDRVLGKGPPPGAQTTRGCGEGQICTILPKAEDDVTS